MKTISRIVILGLFAIAPMAMADTLNYVVAWTYANDGHGVFYDMDASGDVFMGCATGLDSACNTQGQIYEIDPNGVKSLVDPVSFVGFTTDRCQPASLESSCSPNGQYVANFQDLGFLNDGLFVNGQLIYGPYHQLADAVTINDGGFIMLNDSAHDQYIFLKDPPTATSVPEPSSIALIVSGLLSLPYLRRRRLL